MAVFTANNTKNEFNQRSISNPKESQGDLCYTISSTKDLMSFCFSAGWLVDVTGSYTATFLLSGVAMLASAFALSLLAAIRRCRVAMHQRSRPPITANDNNMVNGFTKEVDCHGMIS